MFCLLADSERKCCVCLMETSKDWRVSLVMWITIGSSSKCLNRSDIDEKAMPLRRKSCFSWARAGGSADLRSFLFQKCIILAESVSPDHLLVSRTRAFFYFAETAAPFKTNLPTNGEKQSESISEKHIQTCPSTSGWVYFPGRSTWLKKK